MGSPAMKLKQYNGGAKRRLNRRPNGVINR